MLDGLTKFMSEGKGLMTDTESTTNGGAAESPSLNILAQYIKDLSFRKSGCAAFASGA